MFQAFFNGLAGMLSFSRNLDNISDNIANMNTPGFKGKDTFYRSLTSENGALGAQISGNGYRFGDGDIRQTGNAGDLAISGEGFFVLLNDGEVQYTRAGQFQFNDEGILIDSNSGGQVAAVNAKGELVPIDISSYRVLAPTPTTTIDFAGNLSTDMTSHDVAGITVFNGLGESLDLTFKFTNNSAVTAGSWLVDIEDADGNVIHSGEIRFDVDGTPLTDFNTLSFDITDLNGGTDTISVNFGVNGSFADSTSVSGGASSTIQGTVVDGHAISSLTKVSFSSDGTINLEYANGETLDGPNIALATFADQSNLEQVSGSVFRALEGSSRTIGQPGEKGLGTLVAESIELSNVDLSREFADMIIIQRGYQASSRILNVANQLLDQLYENTRSR
ncbi:flagellar basal-body rod protein FlgF [Paraneptunicella aestuarii]|uniref:flagellar basal-body rod protein FlgF n=1 Tax=Paraneptunicella aestuarii TaxID=2831148 RepID=UPI001E2D9DC4|nr:flagellar basal-body rod protein FlgF [Paraneptunicella aestuarii]UAA37585.1 flagellar basal-body rod protein FlgF [Paraneptunicella aestuarii]